jgi:site-specific DNA-cytosine methylase
MKIAVLFDGCGLARFGLEQAGHDCTGVELDPAKHYLSRFIGSGQSVLADATTFDLSGFDAVWCSPPCQWLSSARTQGDPVSAYAVNLLDWALSLVETYPEKTIWVENVLPQGMIPIWGTPYNAAQFLSKPIQGRQRMIGGRYPEPFTYRSFQRQYDWLNLCPAITATEWKGCATDHRRASRFYGRKLTLQECAYHQGLDAIPAQWYAIPDWYTVEKGDRKIRWRNNLYEAVGNGVPTYMARAFGEAVYHSGLQQLELFSA